MVEAVLIRRIGLPWSLRAHAAGPLAPAWVGLAIGLGVLSTFLLLASFQGWLVGLRYQGEPAWETLQLRIELLQAVMIGYLPTAAAYSLRSAVRELRSLQPVLGWDEARLEGELNALGRLDRRLLALTCCVGAAIGISLVFTEGYWVDDRPPWGHPMLTWNLIRAGLIGWLFARTATVEIWIGARFSQLGRRDPQVDLLDPSPLSAFAQRGLGAVLRLMLFAALFSLILLTPFSADTTLFVLAIGLLAALSALVLPTLGIHARMREVRDAELARVRGAIRRDRERVLEGAPGATRLAELLAYEARIAEAPIWPLDVSTWLRFGLYVGLGLGSWLGAALVERLLDSALG